MYYMVEFGGVLGRIAGEREFWWSRDIIWRGACKKSIQRADIVWSQLSREGLRYYPGTTTMTI